MNAVPRKQPSSSGQFAWSARVLHWAMAAMILTMLFIGVFMVSSLADYHELVALHRPLGASILLLAAIRLVVRRLNPPPEFLPTIAGQERPVVIWSERLLYAFMFLQPLVGWAMLSASGDPVGLGGSLVLPPILPKSASLYSLLRPAHTIVAYLFFATILAHVGGVLFHSIVLRDRLIQRMVPWRAAVRADERPALAMDEPRAERP